jgi:hypothetical protein
VRRIQATIIAGLLLLMLILPQLALAAGPEISDVDVENITFTTATITWTTNTTSDSKVNYGTDRSKNETWTSVYDSAKVNFHSVLLQNLTPKETYYFEVKSTDGFGTATDNNGGEYYSFKTLAWYSISLNPISGSCGDEITVMATVATPGTYHVCWDSLTEAGKKQTFTATVAGSRTLTFYVPEATKGFHKVYLADNAYAQKAYADFEIFPSATIYPDEGPVGTVVTLSGCGFTASQDIKVGFEDTVEMAAANATTGSWEVSLTIPATPGGGHTFVVEVEEATEVWVVWVTKYFRVTPQITASSSSGTVGQTIEVKGTGFQSKEKDIKVTFDGEVGETNTPIVADEKGSWTAVIVVPFLQRGTYTISASGELTRARDVTGIEDFAVGAGILVGPPDSYYVGDTITVAGGGFAAGETGIRVYFGGGPVTPAFTAKGDGTWETSFVLPASSYGSHTILASGTITTAVTTTLSTKAKIESISPVEGAPGDSVTLTGSGFSSDNELTVTVGGVAAAEHTQTQANGNVVINFRVPASPEGKQTVTATDQGGATASRSDYFTVKEKVLPTPMPTSPEDKSKLRSGQVTFHWLTSGSNVTYTLEISETADFTSIFQPQSGIEGSSYTLTEEEALPKGTYYWRVKVVDDYGNESPWSDSRKFTVSPIPIWVWVVVGVVVLVGLMVVAYRETKFKATE